MIVDSGRLNIKRFFSGEIADIAGSVGFGVLDTPVVAEDTRLAYEVVRTPVTSIHADTNTDRIVVKTSIAPGVINMIYEIGIFASSTDVDISRFLSLDPDTESWTNATMTATNARATDQTVRVDVVASGTTNAELTTIVEDLSAFLGTDEIVVGFYATANVSSLRIRLGTDSANYYEFVAASPATGYNVVRFARSTAAVTGSPSWDNIVYLAVRPSATAAGSASVYIDGIRIEQVRTDSLLVARTVPDTPIETDPDITTDVEYSLEISFESISA